MKANTARLVDEVTFQLEEAILSGTLRPGDHLPVLTLSQQFGMSQSTVREALLILERRGLVKTKPRHGARVTRISAQEAVEICGTRALIEAYAVTAGIDRIGDPELETLTRSVDEIRECTLPTDLPQVIRMDLAFHRTIVELANSDTLWETWSTLSGRMGALIIRSLELKQLRIDDVVQFHMEVVDAMRTRRSEIARTAIVHHYLRGFDQEHLQAGSIGDAVQTLVDVADPAVQ